MSETKLTMIGRKERVNFPKLGLKKIDAKIDTGAYSTALHCKDVAVKMIEGKKCLTFTPLDSTHPEYNGKQIIFKEYSKRKIRNSFGEFEKRYVIRTTIVLGGRRIITDITLSDREKMKYPVLIGRKMLQKKFIIDVSKVNIAGQNIVPKISK